VFEETGPQVDLVRCAKGIIDVVARRINPRAGRAGEANKSIAGPNGACMQTHADRQWNDNLLSLILYRY
jgi:hypothetical protein